MSKVRVYIVGTSTVFSRYHVMFRDHPDYKIVYNPGEADLIQFTGGEDVSPYLYGQQHHPETRTNISRDLEEVSLYKRYVGKTPMAGICRGAQLLWVMNGGELYQHVDGHATGEMHKLWKDAVGIKGKQFICEVTSTHHQMMAHPLDHDILGEVLAYSDESERKEFVAANGTIVGSRIWPNKDIEVALFSDTDCLCFQPHPEHGKGMCQDYYFDLLWKYLVNKG